MKRREFLAGGVLSLPMVGGLFGWAMRGPTRARAAELRVSAVDTEAETVFWEYLDHCSSGGTLAASALSPMNVLPLQAPPRGAA